MAGHPEEVTRNSVAPGQRFAKPSLLGSRQNSLPSVNLLEKINQRLDGLHPRVAAIGIGDLSRERLCHTGTRSDCFPASGAHFAKPALEVVDD